MKICPACQTTYVDDSLRFCMKDGTLLGTFEEPSAAAAPIEDEPTVFAQQSTPKMVVPLEHPQETVPAPPVSTLPKPQAQPPRKSNAGVLIALAVLGVVALLGIGGFGAWWLLAGKKPEIASVNTNANLSQNSNSPGNANLSLDANLNANANANVTLMSTLTRI